MTYLLDTNTCIRHLNRRSESITSRLGAVSEHDIVLCSVVKAELFTGAMKSASPEITFAKQRAFVERFLSMIWRHLLMRVFVLNLRNAVHPLGQMIS